jgi:hypothetical protein
MDVDECHLLLGHGDDWRCYNPHVRIDAVAARQGDGALGDHRARIIERAQRNRRTR